jgi:hypothetical protein
MEKNAEWVASSPNTIMTMKSRGLKSERRGGKGMQRVGLGRDERITLGRAEKMLGLRVDKFIWFRINSAGGHL